MALATAGCNLSDPLLNGEDGGGGTGGQDTNVTSDTSGADLGADADATSPQDSEIADSSGDTTGGGDSGPSDTRVADADTSPSKDADTAGGDTTPPSDTTDASDTTPPSDTADTTIVSDTSTADTATADTTTADTATQQDTSVDASDACATSETCGNRVDDDCDGFIDENCPCSYDPSETNQVDTDGSHSTGVCTGQTTDSTGFCPEPAEFESRTSTETDCGTEDNDCDGAIDEGCSCTYDPTEPSNVDTDGSNASGVCPGQTRDASGTCQVPQDYESTETSCSDGVDNDCDGFADSADPSCATGVPGASCSTDADCNTGPCVNDDGSTICAHTIFMTNSDVTADLGGLSGMDSFCNTAASNAGLSGNWQAIASSATSTAKARTRLVAPVYNSDNSLVANGSQDLWDGDVTNSLNFDQNGQKFVGPSVPVWTGTTQDGSSSGIDCNDWTSGSGVVRGTAGDAKTTTSWADDQDIDCNSTLHLYCIDGQ